MIDNLEGGIELTKYKMFALDIDGTITVDRRSTVICTELIDMFRELGRRNIMITLVSSNALPVVVGLKKYLGLSGPCIGETGSLVYMEGDKVYHLTSISARKPLEDALLNYSEYVVESWQNQFRIHDYALKIREEYRDSAHRIYREIKNFIETKYDYVKVGFSGYAIHLTPIDVSKGKALRFIMEKYSFRQEEIVSVGDSVM
ncbi:MAG: phosphoglycolate phosphatase, partial [Desulfurococcales archaeon ex4484_58]